ncbi:unnamed protein product, partial [marine sediment metagenome]
GEVTARMWFERPDGHIFETYANMAYYGAWDFDRDRCWGSSGITSWGALGGGPTRTAEEDDIYDYFYDLPDSNVPIRLASVDYNTTDVGWCWLDGNTWSPIRFIGMTWYDVCDVNALQEFVDRCAVLAYVY